MEVHIRNVPEQVTEKGLRLFLKPHLHKLSIQIYHCQKHIGKKYAALTFLYLHDGERFLGHHGQIKIPVGHGNNAPGRRNLPTFAINSSNAHSQVSRAVPASNYAVNLKFHNQPIYCEKSNREADQFLLKHLAHDEKTRRELRSRDVATGNAEPSLRSVKILPLLFKCSFASCGVWTYAQSELVYAPQLRWTVDQTVKFRERDIILKFKSGNIIEFPYSSILDITMETGSTPSFIISMMEPPRFFELINDPVTALMEQLNLKTTSAPQKRNGPDRHRVPHLNENHQAIVGNCLVYRITILAEDSDTVGEQMLRLQKVTCVPEIVHHRTRISPNIQHIAVGLQSLRRILSGSSTKFPFALKFQIQKLAQNNYLLPDAVIHLVPEVTRMVERSSISVCLNAIKRLFIQIPFPGPDIEAEKLDIESIINILRDNEENYKQHGLPADEIDTQERSVNVAIIHKVKVTPSGTYLYGPEPEGNNRVLRKYPDHHDHFIRVQFCDEDGQPIRFSSHVSQDRIFNGRFKDVLRNGIKIADRVYSFLGFSHSSLRAQSCWFMAPFVHEGSLMYDRMLISDLGDFTVIRSPAKCAARIGQTFSDTPTAVKIDPRAVKIVKDVKVGTRVFSDGVGTMSKTVWRQITNGLPRKGGSPPTCFQIRYAGAKGMISLDSRLEGSQLVLRPSMIKFEASNKTDIEICEGAWKPLPLYLNRQFIKILEDMGTEDSFFLNLQTKEVERLRMIIESPYNASTFLKRQSVGEVLYLPWLINKLSSMNLNFRRDGFLRNVLEMAFLIEIRLLKHKTRIPVEKGWHLHGIMDETGFLQEGQIYCVIKDEYGSLKAITGKDLIISRAPALHPGDVQLVEGVMPPQGSPLRALHNCIVFSQKGSRDLPSQLSGGDLDGDRYYIIWDQAAKPQKVFKPADYPRLDPIDIGRSVTKEDMMDFFIQFMETDQLGRIAVLHRILADQKFLGTLDGDCCTLAEMHSTAVDFSKTGIPVDMSKLPRYSRWRPDFEAPGPQVKIEKKSLNILFDPPANDVDSDADEDDGYPRHKYYESEKILGKLYRAIDERKVFEEIQARSRRDGGHDNSSVMHAVWEHVKGRCRLIQWRHKMEWARNLRDMYEECLLSIMVDYSDHPHRQLTELEVFVGNILGRTGAQSKNQRELSTSLKEKFDEDAAYFVKCIVKDGEEHSEEALERGMACMEASLEDRSLGRVELVSFKYLAAAVCLREVERLPGV